MTHSNKQSKLVQTKDKNFEIENLRKKQTEELNLEFKILKETKTKALNLEIDKLRTKKIEELNLEIKKLDDKITKKSKENASKQANFDLEFISKKEEVFTKLEKELEHDKNLRSSHITKELEILEENKSDLQSKILQAEKTLDELDLKEKQLQQKEQHIEKQIQKGISDYKATLDNTIIELDKTQKELSNFNQLKISLGETSAGEFLAKVQKYEEDLLILKTKRRTLDEEKKEFEFDEDMLKSEKDTLNQRKEEFEKEIDDKVKEKYKNQLTEIEELKEECENLNDKNIQLEKGIREFDNFKEKINGDPEYLRKLMNDKEQEIANLKNKLSNSLDEKSNEVEILESRITKLERNNQDLLKSNSDLCNTDIDISGKDIEISNLKNEKENLEIINQSINTNNAKLTAELKRHQASYEQQAEREERIKGLQLPVITHTFIKPANDEKTELEWLDGILEKCEEYKFSFTKRMLYAFHTSLKVAEWSSLSVLAGVSGTGKSKLPQLYSAFGGMNFISVPVQPNWDCQESMLGYFNSIDNKFDANPVLRFLSQIQTEDFKNQMNIILLDEMNLAHIELYFAEFLSKLEERRGEYKQATTIDVKLGAGIEPYKIELKRNILWVGTMNQDETTKSLSDKVIDRSSVINFPRPTTFQTIEKIKQIKKTDNYLTWKTWAKWAKLEEGLSLTQEEQDKYREILETINNYLSTIGRALGHRVWQSMSYYMSSYPTLLPFKEDSNAEEQKNREEILKIAFEDQLVQKVMPKLRGIETRGKGKTCLDNIERVIINNDFNLREDFQLAQNLGHGQFIWNSAIYLEDKPTSND